MLWVWQGTAMPHHTCWGSSLPTPFSARSVCAQDSASPSQSPIAITSLTNSGESCPGASSSQALQKEPPARADLVAFNFWFTQHKFIYFAQSTRQWLSNSHRVVWCFVLGFLVFCWFLFGFFLGGGFNYNFSLRLIIIILSNSSFLK